MLNTKMTFILLFKVILNVKLKVRRPGTGYRPEITSYAYQNGLKSDSYPPSAANITMTFDLAFDLQG